MIDATTLRGLRAAQLTRLGALAVVGPDARTFLQGQLSVEMSELARDRVLFASCNSAQGRVQAAPWLVERNEAIALIAPSSMMETLAARLHKYVLRSKVKIDAGTLGVAVVDANRLAPLAALSTDRMHAQDSGLSLVRLPGHRQILLIGASVKSIEPSADAELIWRRDDIAAGLPHVYPETHESFVAQMLNIDLLGGVSFNKGCYTGQEIIARTHYRGAIKRRMFRYTAACPPPSPGARIVAGEQHAGDVVDAVEVDGGCDLLAVISLAQRQASLRLEHTNVALAPASLPYEAPAST